MVYRAVVTRLAAGAPFVSVPRLAEGFEYGPLPVAQMPGAALAVGDRVLVSSIEDRPDDLVVIARLV